MSNKAINISNKATTISNETKTEITQLITRVEKLSVGPNLTNNKVIGCGGDGIAIYHNDQSN